MHLRNVTADNLNFDDRCFKNAKKIFYQSEPYKYDSISEFNQMVRQNENKSFIGWEPDEGDMMNMYPSSSPTNSETEMEKFVDEFKSVSVEKFQISKTNIQE